MCDRYIMFQCNPSDGKIAGKKDWDALLDWLQDYEYDKLGLPMSDQISIFGYMHPDVSQKLLSARYQGDNSKKIFMKAI